MEVPAACHIHSSWSYDGTFSLSDLSVKFSARGCRVLMMTEHDRGFSEAHFQRFREACANASSREILVMPGIEYSDAENRVHVLAWGLNSFLGENLPTAAMLEAAKAANGVTVLAHPTRRTAWSVFEPHWTELLLGIEAWNRKYDGWAPSTAAPALLNAGRLVPFVGLDFHTDRQLFPLMMALDIEGNITEASVVRCLRSRRCHARAFGQPLHGSALRVSKAALRVAEQGRRTAALAVRSAKAMVRA